MKDWFNGPDGTKERWTSSKARRRTREAFSEAHIRPDWLGSFNFLPPPHDGPHPLAVADLGGLLRPIKVFTSGYAIEQFNLHYPEHDLTPIKIRPYDGPEKIRQKVFDALEDFMFPP
ncbi:hypothetical protein BH11PAT2_BH11PAT2_04410 [soil metagenome]